MHLDEIRISPFRRKQGVMTQPVSQHRKVDVFQIIHPQRIKISRKRDVTHLFTLKPEEEEASEGPARE